MRPSTRSYRPHLAESAGRANAQNRSLLVELDNAFRRAEADDQVRVIILAYRGKNFSAGHDLGSDARCGTTRPGRTSTRASRIDGATRGGCVESLYLQEWHYYFENTVRWRDLRKITIARRCRNAISGPG